MDEAKLAFVFLTTNSVGSSWVAFEAGFMHSKRIRVIPVALPGIELGQVSPPIGLLQGFNMHSHEAMNNVFEILNQEFQHQHKPSFTQDDFQKLFGADSELASGFFGEYSTLVTTIIFEGKANGKALMSAFKAELEKQSIVFVERGDSKSLEGVSTGLLVKANTDTHWFRIELHSKMCALILPVACLALQQTGNPDYSVEVNFVNGVRGGNFGVSVTARAYGTEFIVQPSGNLKFREITLQNVNNPIPLSSGVAFEAKDLRDLVINLFESDLLQFKPVNTDPQLAYIAKALSQLKRY